MRVKLFSAWYGPKPSWYLKFVQRMASYQSIDWECIPPKDVSEDSQGVWINDRGSKALRFPCRKGPGFYSANPVGPHAYCDFRPTYGELFADRLIGYDWWGWIDLDVVTGDLDRLLPPLLSGESDVVSFKTEHLSGCFLLLKNNPKTRGAFRLGPYQQVLTTPDYYFWDESGHPSTGNICFQDQLLKAGLKLDRRPELMSISAPEQPGRVIPDGGRLLTPDGQEVLFHHFMDDIWPSTISGGVE